MDLAHEEMDILEFGKIETSIVKNDREITDISNIYSHDLQMYKNRPTGFISLIEFETFGAERLEVFRIIDQLLKEIEIKPEEFKQCLISALRCKGLDFYVKLIISSGCDSNTPADIEARRRDHISHFIMRLSLGKKPKTLSWFIQMEDKLFRMRFDSLNRNGFEKFLALNNINYPTLSEEEKHENRENLVAVHGDIDFDNTVFFKVPYLCLRNLVKDRKTFMKRGIAFVPSTDMIHVISQSFRDYLNREITSSKSTFTKDSRLEPIFKKLFKFTDEHVLKEPSCIRVSSLDELASTSYPLCMKIMHQALRKNHHLKNTARFQYGLFLKLIGVSYTGSVDLWKEELLKTMDIQTFDKRYLYNIKYTYGQVGSRPNYRFLACDTIITSRVGFGEYHGCPYKNMTEDTLHENLKKLGLEDDGIVEIEDLAKSERYREACSKCFTLIHKSPLDDLIISPANYFLTSQDVILRERRLKEQEMENLHDKKNVYSDMTLDGSLLELSTWNIEENNK